MKSILTWTERHLPRLFRKLSNRQNFHLKAEMFSFHSKYFVYRELKRAPQKLSFCFKCPDTGSVRILGNILYFLVRKCGKSSAIFSICTKTAKLTRLLLSFFLLSMICTINVNCTASISLFFCITLNSTPLTFFVTCSLPKMLQVSYSPVAEIGKLFFRSTHGSEKVWYRILVEHDLLIIA